MAADDEGTLHHRTRNRERSLDDRLAALDRFRPTRPFQYLLNPDGTATPTEDWKAAALQFSDPRNRARRFVRKTAIRTLDPNGHPLGELEISTVFLVYDHNYSGGGPPVLWETMIFAHGGPFDLLQRRYSSHAAALHGHQDLLDSILHALPTSTVFEIQIADVPEA